MRWLLVLLLIVSGCESRPSRRDCAKFLDHAADLERYSPNADKPMLHRSDDTRDIFLSHCVEVMHPAEIRCALAEKTLEGIDRCVDRHALVRRLDGTDGNVLAELTSLKEQLCACPDVACTMRFQQPLLDFVQRWADVPREHYQPILDQIQECATRIAVKRAPP